MRILATVIGRRTSRPRTEPQPPRLDCCPHIDLNDEESSDG